MTAESTTHGKGERPVEKPRWRIAVRFLLIVGIFASVFSAFVLYRSWTDNDAHVRELLDRQSESALLFDLAIREYVAESIRPFAEKKVGAEEFIPEVMSTSFVARSVFEKVRKRHPGHILKFSSNNPRNPKNQANPAEQEMIRYFNENPKVTEWSGQIEMDGKQYQARFHARRLTTSCLRCHGDPQDAPRSLVERYGDEASFHLPVGQVVALDTIAIPTEKYRAAAMAHTLSNSLVMLLGVVLLLGAIYFSFHLIVGRRLATISRHFRGVLDQDEGFVIAPIHVRGRDEIGVLAGNFNTLATRLRGLYETLEQRVADRTSALANVAEDLREGEQALRESQETMRVLLNAPSEMALLISPDGTIVDLNENLAMAVGKPKQEVIGRNIREFVAPELIEKRNALTREAVRTRTPVRFEEELEGRWLDNTVYPILNEDEDVIRLAVYTRDITDRKRAEDALRASKEKYQLLYDSSADAIMTLAPEKGFLDGNPAAIRMFGCRDGEKFASLTPAALSPDVQPDGAPSSVKAQEMMAVAMEEGSHFFEWRHRRLNGPEFDATVLLTRLTSEGGTFLQATVRDITEQKQREESAARAKAAAESANRSKSEFLANMSHEIRTPMTAILGFVEQLRQPDVDPSSRENYLGIIERNGGHLLGLINDILSLSKIEAGKLEVEVGPCDMTAMIADVASLMRVRAEQQNTSLSVTYESEIPQTIHTDVTRVRQALVNLVGNAVKFTEGGSVRMAVTFLPDWHPDTPAVRIDVIDTGIGIGEEKISRLFEPFMQEDSSMSRRYGGTGLGLAITHHIAELLGGELTVTSTSGEGSTFTLTVPTGKLEGVPMVDHPTEATAGLETHSPTQSDPQTSLDGLRVLLAEDGRDNQLLVGTILRKAGATVAIAENGRIAVEKGVAGGFDVILMDVQMPEMDGHEAARVLRGRGVTCPILALTAHAMASDRERCIEAGCNDHLTKPINRAELIRTVAAHASGKPSSTDAAPVDAIHSDYADDPDLGGVLEQFVAGLDAQMTAMREAIDGSYPEELQRLAHQLKGAGGGYGYPALTEEAAILEQAAKAGDTEQARLTLRRLTDLCQAIRRGLPVRAGSGRAQT